MRWHLKSPASWLFNQLFVQVQIKENIKALRHWPLWGEFTGDRWRASNEEVFSVWWRHHGHVLIRAECCIHASVTKAIIGPDIGLFPLQPHAIISANAGLLFIQPLGKISVSLLVAIQAFWLRKMHWKRLSTTWLPLCLSLNVLNNQTEPISFAYICLIKDLFNVKRCYICVKTWINILDPGTHPTDNIQSNSKSGVNDHHYMEGWLYHNKILCIPRHLSCKQTKLRWNILKCIFIKFQIQSKFNRVSYMNPDEACHSV